MTAYTGTNLYVSFGGTALNADYRKFEPEEEIGTEDGSAGADLSVTRLTTLRDGKATLMCRSIAGTAGTAKWVNLAVGISAPLVWGPYGTATGAIKGSVTAILKSRKMPNEYNKVAEWEYEFEYSDPVGVAYSTY